MSSLENIASAKILASVNRHLKKMEDDIEALKRMNASKGLLISGATVRQVIRLCNEVIDSTRNEIINQYEWVIKESLWPNSAVYTHLENDSKKHLEVVLEFGKNQLRNITALIGSPELFEKTVEQIQSIHDQALTDVIIFIEGQSLTKKNSFVKNAVNTIGSVLKKLIYSGHN